MIKSSTENVNGDNYYESKKQVVKNNYWNEEHEHILESLQRSCFRLSKEYKQKYFELRDTLQWYRIPIIIISSIGGFLSLSNSGYIPPLYNKWISLFVGFTNLTVTIISLVESFKKIDTRMNGSYTTYVNFQKLHDEISIIKRIPPNERDNNGNDTINDLYSKYESYHSDAPILRKLLNDDIGLNDFDEILTPNILKSNLDIESHVIEMQNKMKKLNNGKNNFLQSVGSKFNKKDKKDKNLSQKNNFKSRYTYENYYSNYDSDNSKYLDDNININKMNLNILSKQPYDKTIDNKSIDNKSMDNKSIDNNHFHNFIYSKPNIDEMKNNYELSLLSYIEPIHQNIKSTISLEINDKNEKNNLEINTMIDEKDDN